MNELVSKNPVQRFKQGKKIMKAQFGNIITKALNYDFKPKIRSAVHWAMDSGFPGGAISTAAAAYFRPQRRAFTTNENRNLALKKLRDAGRIDENNKWIQTNPKTTTTVTPRTSVSRTSKPSMISRTSRSSVAPNYYATREYMGKIPVSGINSRDAVLKLQRDMGMTGEDLDGIWGNKTQAAYDKYKRDQLFTEAEDIKASPLSLVEKSNINPNNFVSSIENKYGKPTVESISTQPVATQYDRSGTRNWITNRLGHNPYEYTGAQRRALRYWLNGDKEGTNYDKNLLGVFGNLSQYAKQGAKLVSKNPVERFKANFR